MEWGWWSGFVDGLCGLSLSGPPPINNSTFRGSDFFSPWKSSCQASCCEDPTDPDPAFQISRRRSHVADPTSQIPRRRFNDSLSWSIPSPGRFSLLGDSLSWSIFPPGRFPEYRMARSFSRDGSSRHDRLMAVVATHGRRFLLKSKIGSCYRFFSIAQGYALPHRSNRCRRSIN